ncbi:amidase domain-containing protein [Streptomyces lasiicapitis]|uniref:amidase domain-containing protein n=1 Tax=Streptomyces lasiicapitis TaxID=1923961 RepID=UPI003659BBFC
MLTSHAEFTGGMGMNLARARRMASATAMVTLCGLLGTAPVAAQEEPASGALSASQVDDLSRLTETYLQTRANMVTNHPPTLRAARVAATSPMANQLEGEFKQLIAKGKRYKELDGGNTKAAVDITVTDTSLNGDTATLQVTEYTRLYLPFTAEEVSEGAPEYEEISLPHEVTFTQGADGAWLLASDKVEAGSGPTPSTQVSEPATGEGEADDAGGVPEEEEGAKEAPSSTDNLPGGDTGDGKPDNVDDGGQALRGYNYGKMVKYANKYWQNRNGHFRSYGNDCTNFISQAMDAGGWGAKGGSFIQRRSNKYWFYGPVQVMTSYTWAGAENWYWFAIKHSKRVKPLNNVYKLVSSDVLQADWDRNNNINHTMIVTKKFRGMPFLTYHTKDTHNMSMERIVDNHPRAWWYAHRT